MLHALECYLKLAGAYIRGIMINRWSFFLVLFAVMLINFANFIGIWLVMEKFGNIRGWTFGQIAFIYILSLLSYGLRNLFFFKFTELGYMIQRGELDMVLTKPLNPFIYIMGARFEMGGLSYVCLGSILIFILRNQFNIVWSLKNMILFVVAVISGALIQGAITVFISIVAFFLNDARGLNNFYASMREFIWYPVSLYNNIVKFILFFIIPLAFASYVPAGIFLKNPDYLLFPQWVWQLSLLSGLILFSFSYCLWKRGLKYYHSTGS